MSTKKKVAPKKVAKKVAKKTAKKAPAKKSAPKKVVKGTGTAQLDKFLAVIAKAKANGDKTVSVYTTKKEDHKPSNGGGGFSVNDLKPKFLEAYKHLFCNFNLEPKVVNPNQMAVEWIVKF